MATQKPISSISYNTESFLKEKLDTWVNGHIISSYMYIKHKGEDGDKDHIHFRIEPNKKIDPMDLQEQLREWVLGNDKPLGCRPFRPSKEEDWILYACHDEEYLSIKYSNGEKGEKLPYKWQDIVSSEYYDVEVAFIRAKSYLAHTSVNIATRIRNGEKPMDMIMQGENVYTVNAIMHAVSSHDYQNVVKQLDTAMSRLCMLEKAIEDYGLAIVCDNDGTVVLECVDVPFK